MNKNEKTEKKQYIVLPYVENNWEPISGWVYCPDIPFEQTKNIEIKRYNKDNM